MIITKSEALKLVKKNGWAIKSLSNNFKKDKEIITLVGLNKTKGEK